jgi:hypothetical protein
MRSLTIRDAAITACAASAVVHAWLATVHYDEPLLAISFAAAAIALGLVGTALTRPGLRRAPAATAVLFAALLGAYPVVTLAAEDGFDALGLATKLVEAIGLSAALASRHRDQSFGSADVLVGVVIAMLLLSLGHGH